MDKQFYQKCSIHCGTFSLPELQHEGEEGRIDVPDGSEDKDNDGQARHAPHEPHLDLKQPKPKPP